METLEIKTITDLESAYDLSYYTITGAGGDLAEWVNGYGDLFEEAGIGRPTKWFQTTGIHVNYYAAERFENIRQADLFPDDLTILLIPLDAFANPGKLPLFKIRMQDRWFDDIIDNMNPAR